MFHLQGVFHEIHFSQSSSTVNLFCIELKLSQVRNEYPLQRSVCGFSVLDFCSKDINVRNSNGKEINDGGGIYC